MNKKLTKKFDFCIIGGGIIGLTAAIALAKKHLSIAVIDAGLLEVNSKTASQSTARVFALNPSSEALYASIDIHFPASPYLRMDIWDAVTNASIHFDARMNAKSRLGSMVDEDTLRESLLRKIMSEEHVQLFSKQAISTIHEFDHGIVLESQDGMTWEADFLVVADGANSPCRALLKIPMSSWSYHQHAVVAKVSHELSHQQTAYQVFLNHGPLAFLPLLDQHQSSIVWSTKPEHANALVTISDTEFNEKLNHVFGSKLGEVHVIGNRAQFPLHMRHVTKYAGARWVILGDAAHTIHPLAGLGLNIGLADLKTFLLLIEENGPHWMRKKPLQAFQRQRKSEVWTMIGLMQGLHVLFSTQTWPLPTIRQLGLHGCDRANWLKRLLIDVAS